MGKILLIFTNRRVATVFLQGFISSLPLPLVMGTLDGWLKTENVDLKTIGYFSLVGLPYSIKFLWAPLLDRYRLPFLGRRTGWILLFQILIVILLVAMGTVNAATQQPLLAALAVLTSFCSASMDIAIDAYRPEVLRKDELGPGAGISVVGLRLALVVSGGGAFVLSDYIPWGQVYMVMAGLLAGLIFCTLFAPEPESSPPVPRSIMEAVIEPLHEFFLRKGAITILLFIVLYKLGDVVAGKMTTPFLMEIGFSRTEIGSVNKVFGMIATIVGALWAGGIISKIGIYPALWIFGILQAASNFVFLGLAVSGPSHTMLIAAIGAENICGGMGTAAFVAYLMSLVNKQFTATQYALLSSVMAITRTLAAVPTGELAQTLGWPLFFVLSAVLGIPGLLVLAVVRRITPASASSETKS